MSLSRSKLDIGYKWSVGLLKSASAEQSQGPSCDREGSLAVCGCPITAGLASSREASTGSGPLKEAAIIKKSDLNLNKVAVLFIAEKCSVSQLSRDNPRSLGSLGIEVT